ncbi:hypothetical protein [Tychonema bourrellyi]|uniref:hypothetical protein n=1 Tax=Tychonema bourrellyi TaxID=54313 RepID=UPI0015D493AB|nr:hypothetical protein [Tychonema bourrellyi]
MPIGNKSCLLPIGNPYGTHLRSFDDRPPSVNRTYRSQTPTSPVRSHNRPKNES